MESNLLMSGKTQYAAPTPADGDAAPLSMTSGGRVRTDVTGSVSISGTPAVIATISGTPAVTSTSTPTNGSAYALTTAASTNAGTIKASAGNLFEITVFNSTAATIYVRLYNKASNPTVGTDIPIAVIPVAASAVLNQQFGSLGKRFSTGIAIAVTAAAANNDATVVTAGALISATYL